MYFCPLATINIFWYTLKLDIWNSFVWIFLLFLLWCCLSFLGHFEPYVFNISMILENLGHCIQIYFLTSFIISISLCFVVFGIKPIASYMLSNGLSITIKLHLQQFGGLKIVSMSFLMYTVSAIGQRDCKFCSHCNALMQSIFTSQHLTDAESQKSHGRCFLLLCIAGSSIRCKMSCCQTSLVLPLPRMVLLWGHWVFLELDHLSTPSLFAKVGPEQPLIGLFVPIHVKGLCVVTPLAGQDLVLAILCEMHLLLLFCILGWFPVSFQMPVPWVLSESLDISDLCIRSSLRSFQHFNIKANFCGLP